MLVLTRRKNESIIINDNIKIVVISVYNDRVRLGIEAPPEIPIHRREVFELIKRKLTEEPQAAIRSPNSTENFSVAAGSSENPGNEGAKQPAQCDGINQSDEKEPPEISLPHITTSV